MAEITLDTETLGYIRLFEERTGARVKDCLEAEDKVVFLVYPGDIPSLAYPHGIPAGATIATSEPAAAR